jgi:hypothetical protein
MSNTAGVLKEAGTAFHLQAPDSPPIFGRIHVIHLFSFLCCVFCFVCLKDPQSFGIWIFRNGQPDRDDDRIIFAAMTST